MEKEVFPESNSRLLMALIPVAQLCVFQEQTKPEQKKQDSSVPIFY